MNLFPAIVVSLASLAVAGLARGAESLIYNGSFDKVAAGRTEPDGWGTAGDGSVVQSLMVDRDPQRGSVARHMCTRFARHTASSHAMVAQVARVGVRRGQWYRLSLWARASDLEIGLVRVALTNFRVWSAPGLTGSFVPTAQWQQFTFVFQATCDLNTSDSRFQTWYESKGTLWLDDVAIEETTPPKRELLPVISTDGVTNALTNSSFEGGEGWGCSASKYFDWTADVFRRVGKWDDSQAFHGKRSWKVTLSAHKPLRLYGGSALLAAEVRTLDLEPAGWLHAEPGQSYVFSAHVKFDQPGLPVRIGMIGPQDGHVVTAKVGPQWQRIEARYAPKGEFLRCFVGFGLPDGEQGERTLWIDAAQLERGTSASPYHPRTALEGGIETGVTGNIFTDPGKGLSFRLRAFNDAERSTPLRGRLRVTDFSGRTAWEEKPDLEVPPGQGAERSYTVLAGRRGFFRIHWEPEGGVAQTLRCAVVESCNEEDAVFGFNHAFCQDFLLPLAHDAGMRWWRDWSDQWDALQSERDAPFDFRVQDVQINRVLDQKGRMLMLLPYPSARWSAAVPPEVTRHLNGLRAKSKLPPEDERRMIRACKPARLEEFAEYVRATVKHFRGRVAHYEILNEPLFTHYALPSSTDDGYGYTVSDYLDVLRTACQAAKAADPKCTVIGGIACGPGSNWGQQFIAQGGLRWCDVTNCHWYPTREYAEAMEFAFKLPLRQMQAAGDSRPIWVTEFGLYAEDEPVAIPSRAGDHTMNNAMRPDEGTASVDLVQLATVMFAHGVRKVFFHAGTCQGFHHSSTGNMFFEYGGAPRKMYPAVATMARLLAADFRFIRKWDRPEGLHAYEFRSRGRTVVILWTRKTGGVKLELPQGFQSLDLMGNLVEGKEVTVGETPVYLLGR